MGNREICIVMQDLRVLLFTLVLSVTHRTYEPTIYLHRLWRAGFQASSFLSSLVYWIFVSEDGSVGNFLDNNTSIIESGNKRGRDEILQTPPKYHSFTSTTVRSVYASYIIRSHQYFLSKDLPRSGTNASELL